MSAWLPLRRWALSSSFSEGSEAHGYLTLASGSDPPEAYIVAIHGLCGHRIKTWTSDDGTFWLRDLLAHQVRTTRILTFGYDADVFTRSRNDLDDVARDLLHGLEQDRTNFSGQGKPVIFICHSLGGIVFKKAIVRAHELTQTYGDIVNSTKGVIFLGVPHTGSAHASWASALSILKAVTLGAVDSNRAFMEGLRENSAEFYEISKSFIPRSVNMAIKTFYETREVGFGPSGIMVVNKESAMINIANEISISVNADHNTICKIGLNEDAKNKKVIGTIVGMISETTDVKRGREQALDVTAEDKAIVNTLFSITPKEMWRSVPQPLEGTCDWIVADDTYMKWFWEEKRDNLLWIESPPGYGKSVLARFLVDHHQKRGESVAVCCFFCNSTVEAQSHGTSILRSILHQLFTKNPGMIKHARLAHQTQGPQWVENLATLVTIFENCLEDPNLGNTVIIVDALDEYQDINNPDHLRWILAAMNQSSERQSSLRVILTSRPQPSLLNRLRPVAQLIQLDSVENLPRVKAGLQHFINQEVLDLTTSKSLSDTNRDWLVKKLTAGCQGSFLWVSVAIRSLHEVAGISIGVMEDTLQSPPTELWRMYQNILEKVTFADREWSNHLLQIIVAAYTPPTISQLNFMSAVYQCKGDLGRIPDYIQENFGDTIRNLWGGLVLISDGRACLHHKAMKDFLTDTTDGATTDFGMSHFTENQAKLTMAQNCIWQLKAMKGAQGSISFDFAYAVHNAARHFKEIEHDAKENLFGQLMELYEDESIVTMWRDSHLERARLIATLNLKMTLTAFFEDPLSIPDLSKDVQQWMQNDNLEKNASNVRVASYFGHIRVFRSLLNADVSRYNQVFQDGWTPLCTALDRGQASMVAAILSQGVDVESVSKGQKAIHFAARHSDPKFVQMLLEHQANINSKTGQGATPLSLAAGLGFNNVVEVLLEAKADTQSADLEGDTALHRAARNGHEDVVRVLLLDGAKIEDRNNRGQSPLFIAVQNGKVGVARILLNKLVDEPIDTNHPGILHAAARCGNDDILRLLLDKEIDVKAKDNSGCTPFVYLKADCEPGRIESFLAKGAEINEELQDGTTLLHKAAAQDKISTVQCLLRNGADVKKMTNYGDTPLHLAVSNLGHEEMFKALLDSGAKMEARDDAGNTPFHRAIISWRSQMTLRILKNLGADIEAKNGVGETPLQSAIRKLNAGLVIALIEQHNAHLDVYTSDGMSIIDLADFSYIRLLAEYRVKRNLDFQLPYKLFAVTEVPQMDDNAFQNEKGTLGSVLLKKFELIQLLIKHKMKLDKWRNNISDIKMEVVFTKPYRVEHEATTDPVSAGAGEVTTENTVT